MTEAGYFAAAVHLGGFLLEAEDKGHPTVEVEELALVESQEGVLSGMFIAFERHSKIPCARSNCNPIVAMGKPAFNINPVQVESRKLAQTDQSRSSCEAAATGQNERR